MTAALRLFADWALSPDGLDREVLRWEAFIGNWASRRVAWKLGFRIEGPIRGLGTRRGEQRDGWLGSLRRGDAREPVNPWYVVTRLTGERVVLRPFTETDADACVEGCTDPVTRHWLAALPDPYTRQSALGYIHGREEEHASGRGIYWCAADPGSDRCIGSVGVMNITPTGPTASGEIGYWIHPAARGRGTATEAVQLVCEHAFAPTAAGGLGLRRIDLQAAAGNIASQRVAEKAGFTRAGVLRSAEALGDGTSDDLVQYDRLATDPA